MTDSTTTNIQIALAHHDRQIAELSEMITAQWKEITILKRQLEAARNKLDEIGIPNGDASPSSVAAMAANEKPPHY